MILLLLKVSLRFYAHVIKYCKRRCKSAFTPAFRLNYLDSYLTLYLFIGIENQFNVNISTSLIKKWKKNNIANEIKFTLSC